MKGEKTKKAPDALRTISEAAKIINVQPHVLRFWESRFSQLRPLKRAGGRRYYRPGDIRLLKRIHGLLYESGYTIKGVHKLLREGDVSPPEAPVVAEVVSAPPVPVVSGEVMDRLRNLLAEMKDVRGSLAAGGN